MNNNDSTFTPLYPQALLDGAPPGAVEQLMAGLRKAAPGTPIAEILEQLIAESDTLSKANDLLGHFCDLSGKTIKKWNLGIFGEIRDNPEAVDYFMDRVESLEAEYGMTIDEAKALTHEAAQVPS